MKYCAACLFERTYGTTENPRPVPDLKIHTCGQETCVLCHGYTVINGAPMGAFAVMGGDSCPVCHATGRVPPGTEKLYQKRCPSATIHHREMTACSLPLMHHQDNLECVYKPYAEIQAAEIKHAKACVKKALG